MKLFKKSTSFKLNEEKMIQKIGLISISVSLMIIFLIMSFFFLYTKQKRQKEMVSNGFTLTSMVASYTQNQSKTYNADQFLQVVDYAGSKTGLVYGMIMDTDQKIIAHTKNGYEDNLLVAMKATNTNNPLKQIYKDSITEQMIYEFSRPIYNNGVKQGTVRLGFSPDLEPLFSDSDIRGMLLVCTLFFSMVPLFYYLVRRSFQLQVLSITDELTGLYNRRGFFTLAEGRLLLAKRTTKRMLLLYADLDNLKEINDTLGHGQGDMLIKEAANILKLTFRKSDIIARIGGDEFAVFPVGSGEDDIETISGRLHANIEQLNCKRKSSYKLELSVGIARYDPNSAHTINDLLYQADALMYKNKTSKKKARRRSDIHERSIIHPIG